MLFFRNAVAYGFSGVVTGYFGLLALSLFGYLERRTSIDGGIRHAPVTFFLGIAAIAVAIAPATRASVGIAAAALVVCGLYGRDLLGAGRPLGRLRSGLGAAPPGYLELGALGTLLLFGYPFIAFPADPFQGGREPRHPPARLRARLHLGVHVPGAPVDVGRPLRAYASG